MIAIHEEAARCARLAEGFASIHDASAASVRKQGTFIARSIWPPFKKSEHVMPRWEERAKEHEQIAKEMRWVAQGCIEGWDPLRLCEAVVADEKIDMGSAKAIKDCGECPNPMDCGSWQSCQRPCPLPGCEDRSGLCETCPER